MFRSKAVFAVVAGACIFAPATFALDTKEDLYHARHWLEKANRDYDGHRGKAVEAVRAALKKLGYDPNAEPVKIPVKPDHEKQWKSDDQLRHARKLLKIAEKHLANDGDLKHQEALVEVARAIEQIDAALKVR